MRRSMMMGAWTICLLLLPPACDSTTPDVTPVKASTEAPDSSAAKPTQTGRRPFKRPRRHGRKGRPRRRPNARPNNPDAKPSSPDAKPSSPPSRPDKNGELVVSVRIHLLQSDELDVVNTSMTEAGARALIEGANEAFKSAKVRFVVESIVREQAQNVAAYAKVVEEVRAQTGRKKSKDRAAKRRKKLARDGTLPLDKRIERGIDIYIHRALLNAGGLFTCRHRAIIYGQFRGGRKAANENPNTAKVMAHELGHALGLPHKPCSDTPNLMMEACPKRNPTAIALNAEQIAIVRKWAATGGPQDCPNGPERIED